jgi:hypothetical protein
LVEKVAVGARRREGTRYVKTPVLGGGLLGTVVVGGVFGK